MTIASSNLHVSLILTGASLPMLQHLFTSAYLHAASLRQVTALRFLIIGPDAVVLLARLAMVLSVTDLFDEDERVVFEDGEPLGLIIIIINLSKWHELGKTCG